MFTAHIMPPPRLFLVAPDIPPQRLAACLKAACAAGDVASLLVPQDVAKEMAPVAQALNVAVLTTGEPRDALRAGLDGLHVDAEGADFAGLRAALGRNAILGAWCGGSRHLAMEAAEAGADYLALDQHASLGGEPMIAWCAALLETPCVAFEPVTPADLDILLPQNPDFIRPADAMWESPEAATRIVSELTNGLKG
jgi:thiamine-phosphate pyrophosphorylase